MHVAVKRKGMLKFFLKLIMSFEVFWPQKFEIKKMIKSKTCSGFLKNVIRFVHFIMFNRLQFFYFIHFPNFKSLNLIVDNMVRLWFESKNDLKVKRNTGFLEIHHREEWIPVCSDNWTENNSKVACQQLGYNGGMATPPTEEVMTYHPDTHVFYSNITCTGSEKRLTACESELKVNGCSSKLPVFIQCIHWN